VPRLPPSGPEHGHGRGAARITQVIRGALAAVACAAAVAAPVSESSAAQVMRTSAATAGGMGAQLLDVPRAASGDPRSRLYIIAHLHPGAIIRRRIEISNTTASSLHIVAYPAAATISKGAFVGAAAHTPNELSTWISVAPAAFDVPPGGHAIATVTIAVPRNAPPGEQLGVVWAETRSASAAGGGVIQVSRVGIRIYLSVGAGGQPAPGFSIGALTAGRSTDGQPVVLASVHNTGGRVLEMNGALDLSAGPAGQSAGPFPANLGTSLAIGATEPVTIVLNGGLPDGPWHALVTLRSGLLEHSASGAIDFPATGSQGPPYIIIAGLLTLLFMIIAGLLVFRRRRSSAAA